MADAFNAYRDWLGLPDDSPADHYALLSLAPFETDHSRISAAAERAATKVRSFRPGPRARDWSRLLDEIQKARHCLLDPARKAEYDRKLRLGESSPPRMADSPPPAAAAAPSVAPANPDLYPPTAKSVSRPTSDLLPPASDVVLATAVDDTFEPPPDDDSSDLPMAYPIHRSPAATDTYSAAPSAPRSTPKFQAASGLDPMAPAAIPAISQPESVPAASFLKPPTDRSRSLSAAHLLVLGIIGASLAVIGVALYIASQRQQQMLRAPTPQAPSLADPTPVPPEPRFTSQPIREPSPPPQATAKGNNALTERPGAHRPAPRAEPVAPAPQPAPLPESPPSVAPQPAPSQVTRAEVIALATALKAARQALGDHDFAKATTQIANAESLAKLPQHRDAVARLKEVSGYVEYFRNALATALSEMQAGESFTVGTSTEVAFVEMSKNKVTLHVGGMNRTYDLVELPVGLAMAIADLKLADSNPVTRVVKGSYLLVHKRADAELIEKAKSWWQEAQARGLDMTHLLPFLTDDYDALVKDVPGESEKN